MILPVILVVAVAAAGGIAYLMWKTDQKRRSALQAWATKHGWTYEDRDDSILRRLDGAPFRSGHSRKITTVMSGQIGGRPAMVFGYQYTETTSNGETSSSTTYHFRVYVVSMPCVIGDFEIKPEGIFAKLGNKLGFADVQLESDDFNRAYRLTASSQKLAYDVVPARNIELLLGHPDTAMRTFGKLLVSVESGKLFATDIDRPLSVVSAFLDNVPPFVWKDHGADLSGDESSAG